MCIFGLYSERWGISQQQTLFMSSFSYFKLVEEESWVVPLEWSHIRGNSTVILTFASALKRTTELLVQYSHKCLCGSNHS